ncbi:hypothetical protein AAMO2058_000206700 [Amorphochlora amoebiformis]
MASRLSGGIGESRSRASIDRNSATTRFNNSVVDNGRGGLVGEPPVANQQPESKHKFTVHDLYQWIFVPSNDRLCPPSKKSLGNLLQRLDFNAYNPIEEFADLYVSFSSNTGSLLTILLFIIFLIYSYFTIIDELQDFESPHINIKVAEATKSYLVDSNAIAYKFENTSGSSSNLDVTYWQCVDNGTTAGAVCTAVGTNGCEILDNGEVKQTICPGSSISVTGTKTGGSIIMFLLLTVTQVSTSTIAGTNLVFLSNAGNNDLFSQEGISFSGQYRHEVQHEASFTKLLRLEAEFREVEFNREYEFGTRLFETFDTERRSLIASDFGSGKLLTTENVDLSSTIKSNLIFAVTLRLSETETEMFYLNLNFFDAFAKIGGAFVVLLGVLHFLSLYLTKPSFRSSRAFEPNNNAWIRLLKKKQTQIQSIRDQLNMMKRPLKELDAEVNPETLDHKEYKNAFVEALSNFNKYLKDKEYSEMVIYKEALESAMRVNVDKYENPLSGLDLNAYYASTGQTLRNKKLKRKETTSNLEEVALINTLNVLALTKASRQLQVLETFLRGRKKDVETKFKKNLAQNVSRVYDSGAPSGQRSQR